MEINSGGRASAEALHPTALAKAPATHHPLLPASNGPGEALPKRIPFPVYRPERGEIESKQQSQLSEG